MRPLRSRASQLIPPSAVPTDSKSKKGIRERKEEKWSAGCGGGRGAGGRQSRSGAFSPNAAETKWVREVRERRRKEKEEREREREKSKRGKRGDKLGRRAARCRLFPSRCRHELLFWHDREAAFVMDSRILSPSPSRCLPNLSELWCPVN